MSERPRKSKKKKAKKTKTALGIDTEQQAVIGHSEAIKRNPEEMKLEDITYNEHHTEIHNRHVGNSLQMEDQQAQSSGEANKDQG